MTINDIINQAAEAFRERDEIRLEEIYGTLRTLMIDTQERNALGNMIDAYLDALQEH